MGKRKSADTLEQEWANRVLCSDESCIGVIGPDGRCKECGLAFEGVWEPAVVESDEADEAPAAAAAADGVQRDEAGSPFTVADDDDWESRTLCIDESCIGVIGPDGRCKECGKPFTP
jgi:hypothetical protein